MNRLPAVLLIAIGFLGLMAFSKAVRKHTGRKKEMEKQHAAHNRWEETLAEEPAATDSRGNRAAFRIAVAGAHARIGTTTQALQLAFYLYFSKTDGETAYIEMNGSGFIDHLKDIYSDVETDDKGNCIYNHLTLIRQENIAASLCSRYRYLIYDFGSAAESGFQKSSYLDKDLCLLTAGSKPQEIAALLDILPDPAFDKVKLIFSFVPEDDEKSVMKSMGKYAESAYFAAWTPDLFASNPHMDRIYKALLPGEDV